MNEQHAASSPTDLVVPVYNDVSLLLDLLASREDGFSMVEQITSRSAAAEEAESAVRAGIGVSGMLSLLKIDIGGSRRGATSSERGAEVTSERYHTYGSLLHRLRQSLEAEGAIRHFGAAVDEWDQIEPGDFVEMVGVFRPNPFDEALTTIVRLLEIAEVVDLFEEKGQGTTQRSQGGAQKKGARRQPPSQIDQFKKLLERLRGDSARPDVALFIVEPPSSETHSGVVFVFLEYLRDKSFTELLQGEFRVLGKAVRKIDAGADEEIDLLRGTPLGSLDDETLLPLVTGLGQMEGLRLPEIVTEVSPPAMQLIPIAIYV